MGFLKIVKKFFTKRKATIKIGDSFLELNTSNPHEEKYAQSIENEDFFIAKKLINQNFNVLDLGANIGLTALIYLNFGAENVWAFEPVPSLAKRIKKINNPKIKVVELAVAEKSKQAELFLSSAHNQGHSLNAMWPKKFQNVFINDEKIEIKVTSLDNFFETEVFDFIKIDVEGMEDKVIEGGEKFFKRNQNSIVQIEIYDWQWESTHHLLSRYYNHCYLPLFKNDNDLSFLEISDLEEKKEAEVAGAPNYIYSNNKL